MSERVILHSDMNCFYASVEMLHHPEFAGQPLAVGGDCMDCQLCCEAKRCENWNGVVAGKAGLPGNYFCATSNGPLSAFFKNGERDLF